MPAGDNDGARARAELGTHFAAPTEDAAQKLERDLRVRAHGRLRMLGVWG